ncbi:MAG TPA: glycerophosphodiester phosphodiesterase [Afipia sp.]|uniref:glycerophosphodiester phosphodiesterase n=1 Tax=unclassified Afipia TaxID=2642050 RepID=UPI000467AA47|nr:MULTISPECIES: glycerophosphodiester phosphodiesterase [unclassified Afipia]MAH69755.1 glycerophosphodiester phosphodiesterase [Afipia sp.]OUX61169.1 MAG: glycerophosphodiester phosphodiesterase [Afipia sp. TMED4]HAP10991.1 glycerophosphodiester phosphodiesterase [Afipia sp.]HAP47105.1 glycerophosphodiester phosphodiesterase [Afipia sp.]HBF54079.1 glycerophosphodiester phosphodiesterase [Afipia sp.]
MAARAPGWLTARPIAHRGLHDRARGIVENMPSAIDAAIAANFAIEVDLQPTADNEAMVHHDYALGRLTQGTGELLSLTAAQLKQVGFKHTAERMMTLGDLCARVAGRVPLVLEVKSRFDGSRTLVRRMAEVLTSYSGPVAAMSFDPDQVMALRDLMPGLPRGIVAEWHYTEGEWTRLPPEKTREMTGLRHAFRTQPHFVSYRVDDLPSPAPWIARNIFGCALITWTVRTQEQRARSARYADQMTFEGFIPE